MLKRRDQGEADRLLTVLARERGKVTLLAKGVRRQASRKAGHLEPFTYVELLVAKGKSLDIVTQADTVEAHRYLREDLWRSSWAYYVAELADAFVQDDDPHQLLFDLLLETLGRLDRGADPLLAVRYYEVHLLSLAGYQPQLIRCVQCRRLLEAGGQLSEPGARRLSVSATRRQPPGHLRAFIRCGVPSGRRKATGAYLFV